MNSGKRFPFTDLLSVHYVVGVCQLAGWRRRQKVYENVTLLAFFGRTILDPLSLAS